MTAIDQITAYISSQKENTRQDLWALHELVKSIQPNTTLWFLDGKNEDGKVVSNPNIGYGNYTISYANGSSREFYRIGLSANKTGISVYIMGFEDKKYLSNTFGKEIGKATITGYCIKFKALHQIQLEVLEKAILEGFQLANS